MGVPLNVIDRKHHPSEATRDLLASIGGRDRLLAVTSRFYPKMFRDRQLSLFVQNFEDPHPERLADWIAEKMSGRAYWSSQLSSRQPDQPQTVPTRITWLGTRPSAHEVNGETTSSLTTRSCGCALCSGVAGRRVWTRSPSSDGTHSS